MTLNLKEMGAYCAHIRRNLNRTQIEHAHIVGCSGENISQFECGRNNSAKLLMSYMCEMNPAEKELLILRCVHHEY